MGVGASWVWFIAIFGRPSHVTVNPMLRDNSPVCIVGVLWPKGWIDQDATWYGGRLGPDDTVRWRWQETGRGASNFLKPVGAPGPGTCMADWTTLLIDLGEHL